LWNLAGKKYGASVSELIGDYRKRLPAYASTYLGDRNGGLDSKEAYADFVEQYYALGYPPASFLSRSNSWRLDDFS
jgi:L-alanine-DL-glutamate epimerase-like enolase superfamily enzyme